MINIYVLDIFEVSNYIFEITLLYKDEITLHFLKRRTYYSNREIVKKIFT